MGLYEEFLKSDEKRKADIAQRMAYIREHLPKITIQGRPVAELANAVFTDERIRAAESSLLIFSVLNTFYDDRDKNSAVDAIKQALVVRAARKQLLHSPEAQQIAAHAAELIKKYENE
jgi:hypothetical protein